MDFSKQNMDLLCSFLFLFLFLELVQEKPELRNVEAWYANAFPLVLKIGLVRCMSA